MACLSAHVTCSTSNNFGPRINVRRNWKPHWGGHNRVAALVHFHAPKPDDYTAHRAGRNASHAIFESFVARCDRADNARASRAARGRGCSQYLDDYPRGAHARTGGASAPPVRFLPL